MFPRVQSFVAKLRSLLRARGINDINATLLAKDIEALFDVETATGWKQERGQPKTCVKCNRSPTIEGHDPCIAKLPGVKKACCGHGGIGFIEFVDGRSIYFVLLNH